MSIGGTPVGNMIIKVDLDSAGVEKSMTGLQRQLKSSNKAMGAQLSAFGRGEKSASKYGVMIEGLSNRHRLQARMVQEAQAKYALMSKEYGANSVKAQEAGQQLNEQIALYQETGRELDAVSAEYKEFQRVQEIQNKGWYKAADSMEEWGGKLKHAGGIMDDTGRKLTRGVTVPLAAVGGIATKVGSDFEAGMSKVGAVSGASAQDMEKLEGKAREMGATTVFSAKEASDAFYYMSLAGWDANEMLDGISGVMDLAAASGEDLALVSDIVTDGLTAFGKSAEDSGRMADILASASANANTDVAGLGQAFSYVAPVAGALGYTMEDTSKAIGLMANAGIKSTKAGTALRTMMTNLSKPTAQAQKQMDKLGISLTDSNGEMKDFDTVMRDLRKSFKGLDKEQQAQAASTIFGKEAMSGALAIVNASEGDYNSLTDAIVNSDGAASDMADTMQDNLQGSLKELKSMVEDLFIELYKNLKPSIESVIESAKDLTRWFSELSPKTQENIVKFGLLAGAMGPVLSITGKMTMGIGGLMQGAGALTKTIGLSKGAGLLGAMGSLGPLAIGGIAVAGIVGVGTAIYKAKNKTEEFKEVNLDTAQSLHDQAQSLEESANTFDKLSDKAKISNEQLAELNDLNIQISQSSNPGEIKELQRQYDALAKKSGLSKEELEKLFGANKNIIEQSPEVEKSVSNQGNEFAKSTDSVKEYIQSLYEMSRQELSDEMIIAEENKREILKDNKAIKEEIAALDEKSKDLRELEAMSEEDRNVALREWHAEIQQELANRSNSQERINELKEEEKIVNEYIRDGIGKGLEAIKEQRDVLNEKLTKNDEELEKINELNSQMSDIVLKQAGITDEGEKGLAALDEKLVKNDIELEKLDAKIEKGEQLSAEEQKKYETLTESNLKLEEAKTYLNEELGIYRDLNSLAEGKLRTADEETQKKIESLAKSSEIKVEEGNIVQQIQKKNGKIDESIAKLVEEKEKSGANKAEIDKQIQTLESKKAKNSEVIKKVLEELGLWKDLDSKIKDGINSEIRKGQAVDSTKKNLDSQGKSISENNKKTDSGVQKERERTKEAGKSVNKDVNARDKGTVAKIDRAASAGKNKDVNLKAKGAADVDKRASKPVSKTVNLVGKLKGAFNKVKFWAKGTPPSGHPGGHAIVGEEGTELIKTPGGQTFLSPNSHTLMNLPKGTHVIPHKKTKQMLRNTPHYADGTQGWQDLFSNDRMRDSEVFKLLSLNDTQEKRTFTSRKNTSTNKQEMTALRKMLETMSEQNEYLKKSNELLHAILGKDLDIHKLTKEVDGELNTLSDRRRAAFGG